MLAGLGNWRCRQECLVSDLLSSFALSPFLPSQAETSNNDHQPQPSIRPTATSKETQSCESSTQHDVGKQTAYVTPSPSQREKKRRFLDTNRQAGLPSRSNKPQTSQTQDKVHKPESDQKKA
ncbi:hypothetical protein TWF506_001579 [Arthrobotrys conoides]|uniref:Uncharacterized protein n=1 Tax=Arthrobotrys conoides TaxID=74498 RepID=A0AAN8S1W7_9PEZI